MFSVEPTFERTFFRSGAEVVVVRRLSLGAEALGLVELGFLSAEEVVEDRGTGGVVLTRVGATAEGTAPGTVLLFFTELTEVLLDRLRSTAMAGGRETMAQGQGN